MIIPLTHYDNFATHFFQVGGICVTVPVLHPPPPLFFCLSAKRSVLYVDDDNTQLPHYDKVVQKKIQAGGKMSRPTSPPPPH